MSEIKYKAADYLRLSKEDGDKIESDSITNQRDLILDYIKSHPEIELCDEMVDDGYTGSNFNRPAFKHMLEEITKGNINCVIVKDLSRFAREYVGSGYYLEKLFPTLGVRFIAINDNVDTASENDMNNALIMSFKNILNDSYVRDISVKIRSQFEIKRKKGEFIGAFPVFGYIKSISDKHKLEVDKLAADVVKSIFCWRLEGMSAQAIANKLNLLSVPSPAEYKKQAGLNYSANLQVKKEALWSAQAVIRILKNEVYTGVLIQGKNTTPNYKVKQRIQRKPEEWSVIENAHEPIITKEMFETAKQILKQDTRTSPQKDTPHLFSGFLVCADCGVAMVRKSTKTISGSYAYYICSVYKFGMGCSSHSIKENILYDKIKCVIEYHCKSVLKMKDSLEQTNISVLETVRFAQIESSIKKKTERIKELKNDIFLFSQMYKENKMPADDFNDAQENIMREIDSADNDIEQLYKEKETVRLNFEESNKWMDSFAQSCEIRELTRKMLATLIDKIYIYDDKKISVVFRHQDKFEQMLHLVNEINNAKEAV